MKTIKKAKVVNLSLKTPKDLESTTIHMANEHSQEAFQSFNLKQKCLINDCYEAIKIISNERVKLSSNEKKGMMKTTSDMFMQFKKTGKEHEIKLPILVAESIELILKAFIKGKAEEKQQSLSNGPFQSKSLQKRACSKQLLLRKNKENTESSVIEKMEAMESSKVFKMTSPNHSSGERYQKKIAELENQLVYFKQKLTQQSSLVGRLEARQLLMRKRFHNQMQKIVRNKNILSIQTRYEKEMEDNSESPFLMNVNGRTMDTASQNRKKDDDASSYSRQDLGFKDALMTKKKKFFQGKENKDSFKPYSSTSNMAGSYVMNNLKTLKEAVSQLDENPSKLESQLQNQTEQQTARLKREQSAAIEERKKTMIELESMLQSGQNIDDLEKALENIDQHFLERMRQIGQEEYEDEKTETKTEKDEQLEGMQVNGFNNEEESKVEQQENF